MVGLFYPNSEDRPDFLTIDRKMVVFDTLFVAQSFVPRLGGGRRCFPDVAQESFAFSPLSRESFNRAVIYTGYDPYDVPSGFRAGDIFSEARGLDWRSHVFWGHVYREMIAWADSLEVRRMETEEAIYAGVSER